MRARFTLVLALSLAALQPSAAQESPSSRDLSSKGASASAKPAVSDTEKEAAAARTRNEARERMWDDKMKRTMRSICSGANGC